jgi:transcription elongation factor Elf1
MGGRKKTTKKVTGGVAKKQRATLPKTFDCPQCSHSGSIEVQL